VPEALRLHDTGVLVGGELVELVFDPDLFLHFGEEHSSAQWRGEGRNQEAMIAASVCPGKRGGGVAADAVGDKPFATRRLVPVLQNITRNLCHKKTFSCSLSVKGYTDYSYLPTLVFNGSL